MANKSASSVYRLATVVCAAGLVCSGTAMASQLKSKDPLFAGASHVVPKKSGNFNFAVSLDGSTYVFTASLTLHYGNLTGTVTAPTGCPGTVNAGSTNKHRALNLNVTFGGNCLGEPGSFVGTLKFGQHTGTGTFTDPYTSGPYTVY